MRSSLQIRRGAQMHTTLTRSSGAVRRSLELALSVLSLVSAAPVVAASLSGQVLGGGAPIANSTVTLWAASPGAPKELATARSGADGRFTINAPDSASADTSLYLVAQGRPAHREQGERRQPTCRAHGCAWQQALRPTSRSTSSRPSLRCGHTLNSSTAPRSRGTRSDCALPPATCPASSTSRPAAGAARFRTR